MQPPHKFHTLDILRGVAALAVVEFHSLDFAGRGHGLLQHAYLAVDFFFMLSGFVLTSAYQHRLDRGWSSAAFLKVRLIRLYPLYLLGLAGGVLLRLIDPLFGKPSPSAGALFTLVLSGLLVLPAPREFIQISSFAFPFDVPAWSLFFEAIANLVHTWLLRRRTWIYLTVLTSIAGCVLLYFISLHGQMDIGPRRTEIIPGIARVLFSYTLGILLFKAWQTRLISFRVHPSVAAILLLLLMAGPSSQVHALAYDLVVTAFCFPLLLLLSSESQHGPSPYKLLTELGVASYAIYILHVPILAAYFAGLRKVLPNATFERLVYLEAGAFLPLIFAIAFLCDRLYDQPVRRLLRIRFGGSDADKASSAGRPAAV